MLKFSLLGNLESAADGRIHIRGQNVAPPFSNPTGDTMPLTVLPVGSSTDVIRTISFLEVNQRFQEAKKKTLRMVVIIISGFFAAWTPYVMIMLLYVTHRETA